MRRREFMTGLGSAAVWPLAARAQQAQMPVIGFLYANSSVSVVPQLAGFRDGLKEAGYVEGRNVAIEYRYADGHYERLPALAADLVGRRVAVIVPCASSAPGLAAKAATSTIPIVFQTGADPVADGLVSSMNRPGGNVTGVSRMNVETDPKRLEILHQAVPMAAVIAVLVNADSPRADSQIQQLQKSARSLGLKLEIVKARAERDLEDAFATMVRQGAGALLAGTEPSMQDYAEQTTALALRHAIPTMFSNRKYIVAGGLMSYDSSLIDSYRQVGVYVGRILKGDKPADLPVLQPTKFELVINVKTAKALGVTIPETLLATADEVIQ